MWEFDVDIHRSSDTTRWLYTDTMHPGRTDARSCTNPRHKSRPQSGRGRRHRDTARITMTEMAGYRRLAVHVLLRAFQDSMLYVNNEPRTNLGSGRRLHCSSQVTGRHRESSMRFLQSNEGLLHLWCAWLDLSVEQLQQRWRASLSPPTKG